ncbi:MAG: hypothetical protein ACJARD_000346 [Alphaproteobacteria bacterium]|jgi:hypothetical protein
MSNNNHKKTNMADIVSKAQKSVNHSTKSIKDDKLTKKKTLLNAKIIHKKSADPKPNIETKNIDNNNINNIKAPILPVYLTNKASKDQIVSVLCDGIRDVHSQSINFTDSLRQKQQSKAHSLSQIHAQAFDNFHKLSYGCFQVMQTSLTAKKQNIIIQKQAETATQVQKAYVDLIGTLSQASLDIMKNSASWFYNKSKK